MKNGSKIKKIVPALALTLPLALLAVLGAFASFKTVKANADSILPPDSSNGYYQSSISTRNAFDINYGLFREGESVFMFTTIGHSVSSGLGISTQTNLDIIGVNGGVYKGRYSISESNIFMSISAPVTTADTAFVRADYNGGAVYLDRNAYTHMFRNFGLDMPQSNAMYLNPARSTIRAKIAKPIDDVPPPVDENDFSYSLEYDTIVVNEEFYGTSAVLQLKSWDFFEDNNYVKDGYILLLDYVIEINIPLINAQSTSVTIAHDSSYYTAIEWQNLQSEGIQAYAPYIYTYVPVKADTIGIEVITNGISDILNTEFIPGFRLWYFLLIGLGCAIVGIALKFFLGG